MRRVIQLSEHLYLWFKLTYKNGRVPKSLGSKSIPV